MHRNSSDALGQAGSILPDALGYHARGWSIIPIRTGTKKPACQKWKNYQTERPDEARLKSWFANRRDIGMAVIFGDVSGGLVCRDFDTMESYHQWSAAHPDLAATLPTVATARGRHVYFRSDHRGIVHLEDGELRGAGYCLLPPSLHPSGTPYTWVVPLPDGELPIIHDPGKAGLAADRPPRATENTETTETTEEYRRILRNTEAIGVSVLKLSSPPDNEEDIDSAIHDSLEKAIQANLPKQTGCRNAEVFELARSLKAIPRLADAEPDDLLAYVRRWHDLGVQKGVIGTKPFEETQIDFLIAWPKVRFPKGEEPMTMIFARAKSVALPAAAAPYEQSGLRLLVALCAELQRASGEHPFFLSCRTAGRLLEVDHTTAWRWLFLLRHHEVIVEVQKGSQATGQASRYRYQGD